MAITSTSPQKTSGGATYKGGGSGDIGEWWQDLITTNEIAKERAKQESAFLKIQEAAKLNSKIFDLTQSLFNKMSQPAPVGATAVSGGGGAINSVEMPGELQAMMDLFAQGGEYGAGQNLAIERGGQQAMAAGQIGLASTGMSSGTNAAGLSARVEADKALAKAGIEDQRVQALSGAFETGASAKLGAGMQAQQLTADSNIAHMQAQTAANMQAQEINAANQRQYLATLASMKPNFVAA